MYRCVMVEWLDDWSDAVRGTYARMAWIDHNAATAQHPAQGDEGRDDDRDEPNGGEG